ncbi:mll1805 [Mesorhizobium japonicum MAFF 303099]|uniref:Mll1805 protein n=2 Tax=Mesorhizobium japonicum TaxID=2066070 RepID=Q98JS6_RHILO|nr:mll1805 [Mesorhizobium japonicum MAFF 303099]
MRRAPCDVGTFVVELQPTQLWRESSATAAHSGYMPSSNSVGSPSVSKAGTLARIPLDCGAVGVFSYYCVTLKVLVRCRGRFSAKAGATQMARLLLAKMASAAALVSTSVMLSGCWTIAGRPIICDFGFSLKDGRCAKVTKVTNVTKVSTPRRDKSSPKHGDSHY